MSRAKLLFDLQDIDLTRDAAAARLKRVIAALDQAPGVAAARVALEGAEAALAARERELAERSRARDDVRRRLKAEEGKLYGGEVRAARDVQNFQREVDALKRRLGELEDALLEAMLARDAAVAEREAAHASLAAAEASTGQQQATLAAERSRLTAALRGLDRRRATVLATVPPDDQALYERLRRAKGGRVIADIAGRACSVCGIELPVEEAHRARDGAVLVFCTGCGRIMHG